MGRERAAEDPEHEPRPARRCPQPNVTASEIEGGMGLFYTNGDVTNFPIGKGNEAMQFTMSMALGKSPKLISSPH